MAELEPEVRQANLAFAMLGSPHDRESEWVARNVDGYQDLETEALRVKIRRDVEALRRAGVPIAYSGGTLTMDRDRYELEPVDLTEEEASAVGLAVDLSTGGSLGAFARSGWTKLAASGATRVFDSAPLTSAAGDANRIDPQAFHNLLAAIELQKRVSFDFTPAGGGHPQRRTLDPWDIVSLNNRAYLVGWDIERDADRIFRLVRVANVTLVRETEDFHQSPENTGELVRDVLRGPVTDAIVTVRRGTCEELAAAGTRAPGARGDSRADRDEIRLHDAEFDWVVRTSAAHAADLVAVQPETVREQVIALLKHSATPHDAPLRSATSDKAPSPEESGSKHPAGHANSTGSTRLVRLLNLLPYITRHQGKSLMEIARDLGSSVDEVRDDLNRLLLSGVGRGPGEMFDLEHTWRGVTVLDDQGLTAPLHLKPTEAHALLLLLESLETLPGLVNVDAVRSAADKIRRVNRKRGVADVDQVGGLGSVAQEIRQAIDAGKQLELRYYSASSDRVTERTVSPVGVFQRDEQAYLQALDGDRVKSFRLDRIREVRQGEGDAEASISVAPLDPDNPFGLADAPLAQLLVRSDATWMADYWELEIDEVGGTGAWVPATFRFGSEDWLVRFCLAHADRLRLVEPESLVDTVRERSLRALDALR